jgi:hypothetical protein
MWRTREAAYEASSRIGRAISVFRGYTPRAEKLPVIKNPRLSRS